MYVICICSCCAVLCCCCFVQFFLMTSLRYMYFFFFFSSRRRHTRFDCDWSSDVCSSDLELALLGGDGRPVAFVRRDVSDVDDPIRTRARRRQLELACRGLALPRMAGEIGRASCRERV